MKYNTKKAGTIYENAAAEYLKDQGYRILSRNFRCRLGEIDIIAQQNEVLVFVEVKYRKSNSSGYPEDAVNLNKQHRIIRVSLFYIMKHYRSTDIPMRYDVIALGGDGRINHIVNAYVYEN